MEIGVVYRLFYSDHPEVEYIGSTKQGIKQRLRGHKSDFFTERKKTNFYQQIRDLELNWNDLEYEILEECGVDELKAKELEYQIKYESLGKGNLLRAKRSASLHRQLRSEYHKKYMEEDESRKRLSRDRAKQHYQDNKGKKIEYAKKYYDENKERFRDRDRVRARSKVTCEQCQKEMCRDNLSKHRKICPNRLV